MRKLLAIALLALFGLPCAASLLALQNKSEARLPACCRRNGKHHCMMSAAERIRMEEDRAAFRPVRETCPYCPVNLPVPHYPVADGVSPGQAIFASLVCHPTAAAQIESRFRIARDRARGKRGPPVLPNSNS